MTNHNDTDKMNTSSTYPTTSDISAFMKELGYLWSNEAQTFYDYNFQLISRKSAERLYNYLVGSRPFDKPSRSDRIEK